MLELLADEAHHIDAASGNLAEELLRLGDSFLAHDPQRIGELLDLLRAAANGFYRFGDRLDVARDFLGRKAKGLELPCAIRDLLEPERGSGRDLAELRHGGTGLHSR